jgi:hypothetical protein
MALSSGSTGLEAVVVLGDGTVGEADLAIIGEFGGAGVTVHAGDARGTITTTSRLAV